MERKEMFKHLRYLLKDNFPNDTEQQLEMKYNSLFNYPEEWWGKEIELYFPKFRGIVLRVGLCCKETNQKTYFSTDAERELEEILKI